jgi:dTDP-4-amino-4,6-dideoxygalactose transaminase
VGRLYLSPPDMAGTERERLLAAFDSNWITTTGSEVAGFEADLAAHTGAEAAVALSSGTAALHLALLLSGVRPDDEVWVSTLTFIAPANAARYLGARLRFLDSERETWNLDPGLLEDALLRADREGRLPAAVIAVDIYGQCAQLDLIAALCERFGVVMIEDAAEALGATWRGRAAGTWGRLGALSFNGNKIITTGGGGMITTDDAELARRAKHLTTQARLPGPAYRHDEIGYNYRLTNVAAALGVAQLEQLPAFVEKKLAIAARYDAAFPRAMHPPRAAWATPTCWLYSLVVGRERDTWMKRLADERIESRPIWTAVHEMPMYRDAPRLGGKIAEELAAAALSVPCSVGLTEAQQERVIQLLKKMPST